MSNEYQNGVAKSVGSIRAYQIEPILGDDYKTKEYPKKFRLNEEETGFPKDQGNIGACVGCATSEAFEAALLRDAIGLTHGEEINADVIGSLKEIFGDEEISEWYTYGTCRKDGSGWGMFIDICLDKLHSNGTVPKKYFNVQKEMPEISAVAKKYPELVEVAEKYKIGTYFELPLKAADRDLALKYLLTTYRMPIVGIYPQGFGESHCILITGWDDEQDSYHIKNSWGKDWGDNGYCDKYKKGLTEAYFIMSEKVNLPFTDVKETDWFYNSIKHAYLSHLMEGRTATEFAPNETMTRAEMATLTSRLLETLDERLKLMESLLNEK